MLRLKPAITITLTLKTNDKYTYHTVMIVKTASHVRFKTKVYRPNIALDLLAKNNLAVGTRWMLANESSHCLD